MNRITRLIGRAYSRPPLSWTVQIVEWLATPLRWLVGPLERRWDERRAQQMDDLAALLDPHDALRHSAATLRRAAALRRSPGTDQHQA